MLYETLLHGQIFLCMLYFGLVCGIVFEIIKLIESTFKKNKIVCIILDSIFMIISAITFVIGKNITNFGEFRMYLLIPFILGIIILHYFIGNLVEKFLKLIYNMLVKVKTRIKIRLPKFKRKKKLGENAK